MQRLWRKDAGQDHPEHRSRPRGQPGQMNYKDAGRFKGSDTAARRSLSGGEEEYPELRLVRSAIAQCLRQGGGERQVRQPASLENLDAVRKALPRDDPQLATVLSQNGHGPFGAEEVGRGRAADPRVPHHSGEDPTRLLDDVQHQVDAGRAVLLGPEDVCRRRTASAGRAMRGMKQREAMTVAPQGKSSAGGGRGAAGAAVQRGPG